MSPVATREHARKAGQGPGKRPKKRSKKRGPGLLAAGWPLLLLLAATPFAVRGASVLALSGPSGLRLFYPWMALVQAHASMSLDPEQRDTLAAWALWVQLPLYGLLLSMFALRRRWKVGVLILIALHLAGVGGAILLAR